MDRHRQRLALIARLILTAVNALLIAALWLALFQHTPLRAKHVAPVLLMAFGMWLLRPRLPLWLLASSGLILALAAFFYAR